MKTERQKPGTGHAEKQKKHENSFKIRVILCAAALLLAATAAGFAVWKYHSKSPGPEETVKTYFSLIEEGQYEAMYEMLSSTSAQAVDKEAFQERNQNIYEGIGASDIRISFPEDAGYEGSPVTVAYTTKMKTSADEISFDNSMQLVKEEGAYKINWDSTLIFPALKEEYKVRILTENGQRGTIYDRNGTVLAGNGTVSEVGLVPGKMGDDSTKAESVRKLAEILELSEEGIQNALDAEYVREDSFVPLKKISKNDAEKEAQLLAVPGVMINDASARVYPLGASAGHLTGYVQAVTAEDLEKQSGKGYDENSVIGRAGLEAVYEDQLRPVSGASILIVNEEGETIETVAYVPAENGKDVHVTIDAFVQQTAYEQFAADPGTAAVMNPQNGEVLALVSTPGYDPNAFVLGMSNARWDALNNDPMNPLMNRFVTSWVPGSTLKGITAAIGVDTGKIDPAANQGWSGLSWQKDESWGDYFVTTLTDYGGNATLENALVYSDNIYFARAALDIGADTMAEQFKRLGFEEEMPFEIGMQKSTFDDDGRIDSDIQLADTGYGQGQVLVNPLHLLSMYSMFVNEGNMVRPTLEYQEGNTGSYWKEGVISPQSADTVKQDLVQVIENPSGTGARARIEGTVMLGKTGTAEIKESQDDTTGIERGWFICETLEGAEKPVAAVGMVEDVKSRGGSSYVTEKIRNIVAAYLQQ